MSSSESSTILCIEPRRRAGRRLQLLPKVSPDVVLLGMASGWIDRRISELHSSDKIPRFGANDDEDVEPAEDMLYTSDVDLAVVSGAKR